MAFSDRPNLVLHLHGYVPETNAISSFRRLTSLLIQYLSVLRNQQEREQRIFKEDQALLLVREHRLVSVRS